MIELVLRYSATFALHAAIGTVAVLIGTWLLYRLGRHFGWNAHGPRGPDWLSSLFRVLGFLALLLASVGTGLQTGAIHALARAIEHGSQELVLTAALEAGKPLGIHSADQKLALADAERLIAQWAPRLLERSRNAVTSNTWMQRAGNYWGSMPTVLRGWIAAKGPRTETTPRELVHYAWRNGAAPTISAAKWQALLFAYGLAALMIVVMAAIEWSWLAWTRRVPQVVA